jgi:hypothetical protein
VDFSLVAVVVFALLRRAERMKTEIAPPTGKREVAGRVQICPDLRQSQLIVSFQANGQKNVKDKHDHTSFFATISPTLRPSRRRDPVQTNSSDPPFTNQKGRVMDRTASVLRFYSSRNMLRCSF